MIFIFLAFNLLISVILIRLIKSISYFEQTALNLLFLVSVYAVFTTHLKTIYIIPLVGIPIYYYTRGISLGYLVNLTTGKLLLVANVIWLVFFTVFFAVNHFTVRVPHVDLIISARMAYYNDLIGVENTQGYYNLFSSEITNEIYHYFELWLTNLGHLINRELRIENLFFLSFPLVAFLSFLGFKEILKSGRMRDAFILLWISILICNPYDFICNLFELDFPLSALGGIFFNLKLLNVFPIVLYFFIALTDKEFLFWPSILICFFYPLIIPVLLPAIILFEFYRNGFALNRRIIGFALFTLLAGIFMLYNSVGPVGLHENNFMNLQKMLKILSLSLLVPAFSYAVIFFSRFTHVKFNLSLFIKFWTLALFFSIALWFALHQNIDANQFFSIPFSPFLSITAALALFDFFLRKRIILSIVFSLIFITSSFSNYYNTDFITTPESSRNLLSMLPKGAKVLLVPLRHDVKNIFDYTERMSNPLNPIFLQRDDIHLINIAASLPPPFKFDNPTRVAMFEHVRTNSPYFKECGEYNDLDISCLISFMKNHSINYLLIDKSVFVRDDFRFVGNFGEMTLYIKYLR